VYRNVPRTALCDYVVVNETVIEDIEVGKLLGDVRAEPDDHDLRLSDFALASGPKRTILRL
jgi:hypothetical protein